MRLHFLVISLLFSCNFLFASNGFFTKEEKQYIKEHPTVKIAMLNNFKPFSFVKNGDHLGMSKDILEEISKISGLKFSIELSRWTEALNKFKNKKVDMISGISYTKQREAFTLFTEPFYEIPTFLFGMKNNDTYQNLESLKNKKVGVSKSIFYIDRLKQYGINVVELSGSDEKVKQMVLGNIDYFLASYTSGTKAIKKAAITSIKPIAEFNSIKKEDLRFGIRKDKKLLYSIIKKSMIQISTRKYDDIIDKWIINIDLKDQLNQGREKLFAQFNDKEIAYLKRKKVITYCIDPKWMPFEGLEEGRHTGISMEYKNLFQKKLSIPFQLVKTNSWEQSIQFAREKKCDILSFLAMKTPQRKKFFDFTTSYVKVPFVIATKNDVSFISDLSLLDKKKVAVPKGYASAEMLKEQYPNLELVPVKDTEDGLRKVLKGDVFGLIGTLPSVGYLFQNRYLGELKIAGKFDHYWELAIASQKDAPILHSILQKTLDSITPQQKKDIYSRWVAVKYEQSVDYKKIWEIIFFALTIIFIILYWNRKLEALNKELKRQQKITQQALMVKSNFLANISHEIRTPMNSIVNMAYLANKLSSDRKQKEYLEKIEFAANTLLQLINNVLDISKIDAGKTEILKTEFSLDSIIKNIESIASVKAIENNINFEIIVEKNVPSKLIGDSLRIEQVLINLISNGIKFTNNGNVTLTISKKEEDLYQFCITDTGIGMNEEQLSKIFEPFTQGDDTTTRNFGGTGLGLTISKELIGLMDGKIWVESIVNQGSIFYFILPLKKVEKENTPSFPLERKINFQQTIQNRQAKKIPISIEHEKELFKQLKSALHKKRPNLANPLVSELEEYNLQTMDIGQFEYLKSLISRYKFKEALELLTDE